MRFERVPRRVVRPTIILPIVVALAVTATACAGRAHDRTAPDPTTGTTSAPTTRAPDPTAAVLAAYQEFWRVWLEANDPPNPNDPNLEKVDTGAQLTHDRAAITRHLTSGEVIRLPAKSKYVHRAAATLLRRAENAVVLDCAIDDAIVSVAETGRVVDASVQTQLISADMVLEGGRWKVVDTRFVHVWPGVVPCGSKLH
jgi:hypothetical protein